MFNVPLLLLHHYAVSGLLMDTIICLQSSRNLADPVSGLAPSAGGSSAGDMSPVPSTSSTTSDAAANVRASVDGSQSSSGIQSRPAGTINTPDDTRTHPGNDFTFVSTGISAPL